MPSFTISKPDVISKGLIIPVNVGLSKHVRDSRLKANQPIPNPITLNALIDTGATITSISPKIVSQLGLTPRDVRNMLTAGYPTPCNIYDIYLDFVRIFGGPIVFDPLEVMEAPLKG